MAERRMFAKTIVLSDAFLDMPLSARCLYFTLGMLADDDGFINAPKSVMRQCGASDDDLKVLLTKRFVLAFESGVIVIKHWRINNYLRNDRYTPTKYIDEMAQLTKEENGGYSDRGIPGGIPNNGIPSIGKDNIGKDNIGKDSLVKDIISAEPETASTQVISLILNDKTEYPITSEQVAEWSELYPAVDVMQELRGMKGWLISHPEKRKTKRGILKFVNSWLAKKQDMSGSKPRQTYQQQQNVNRMPQASDISWMKDYI